MLKLEDIKKVLLNLSFIAGLFGSVILSTSCEDQNGLEVRQFETDSITDIDGNVYLTVKIGNQWWMAENLKVTRYRNGDSVMFVGDENGRSTGFDSDKWKSLINYGAYCLIAGDDSSSANFNGRLYGLHYNAYVISDPRNIAPAGWHVPTDEEWKEMEKHLGMKDDELELINWRGTNEGNKLKIQKGWYRPSDKFTVWGTNESGFSASAGSCKMFDGTDGFPGPTYIGFWWTSTAVGDDMWYRYLDYNKANVFRYSGPKTYGFNIRCVKDKNELKAFNKQ